MDIVFKRLDLKNNFFYVGFFSCFKNSLLVKINISLRLNSKEY